MPSYTIETAYRITIYRQRTYEADNIEQACAAAIADGDWSDSRTDNDSAGQVHVTGVWEGRDAAHVGRPLPFGEKFEETVRRKAEHFAAMLRVLYEIAPSRLMPVIIHAAVAKAEAILSGADDPDCPDQVETPWGRAETARLQGEGVVFYSTPSHGGFRLDARRNAQIPERWRNESRWYEEDWQWAKVAVSFPELFADDDLDTARQIMAYVFGEAGS
jgi:hypothetical protein